MDILLAIILMVAGLFLLIKGSDAFVDIGTKIGKMFKMSEVVIGLTIVCIGTSLPELLLSITASMNGSSDLLIGNIIGTNIFNMCCILGIICLKNPLKLLRQTIRKDMNMSLISSTVLFVLLMDIVDSGASHNAITRTDGIILLLFFMIFMYYTLYEFGDYLRDRREKKYRETKEKKVVLAKSAYSSANAPSNNENEKVFSMKDMKRFCLELFLALVCIAVVYIGAELVVNNAVIIARHFNVSETFISIAIIAIGTSLPEISTSIAAIKKNRLNIAIGNLIGSNMFNTLFVIGTSALINPIKVSTHSLVIDAAVFVLVCLVLRLFTKKKPEITSMEGFTLLTIYGCYMVYVLYRH